MEHCRGRDCWQLCGCSETNGCLRYASRPVLRSEQRGADETQRRGTRRGRLLPVRATLLGGSDGYHALARARSRKKGVDRENR